MVGMSDTEKVNIPEAAMEAARLALEDALGHGFDDPDTIREILEAAAPHMGAEDIAEVKLAAIIVLLDPFEKDAAWMENGGYAVEAIRKIRDILDAT